MEAIDTYEERQQLSGTDRAGNETWLDIEDYGVPSSDTIEDQNHYVSLTLFNNKQPPKIAYESVQIVLPLHDLRAALARIDVPGSHQTGAGTQAEYVCAECGRSYNDGTAYTDHVQGIDGLACPIVNEA